MTRRLRVLSEHPHVGRPNDVVREFPNAQAYVDIGVCEWIDPPAEPVIEQTADEPVVVVDRSHTIETTDRGAVETTSARASANTAASRPGKATTSRRRAT